jgi:hypothetical protein
MRTLAPGDLIKQGDKVILLVDIENTCGKGAVVGYIILSPVCGYTCLLGMEGIGEDQQNEQYSPEPGDMYLGNIMSFAAELAKLKGTPL